jgi:predicted RNase H-like HicB family nuclease
METEAQVRAWRAPVIIKPWTLNGGGYSAEVPCLQGSRIIAPSVEEAIRDIYEVIEMSIASRIEHGEPLPRELKEVHPEPDGTIQVDLAIALP